MSIFPGLFGDRQSKGVSLRVTKVNLNDASRSEGGKITSKVTTGCYKLAEKGCTVSRDGYITSDFVPDCIKQGKILNTDPYKVKAGTTVRGDTDVSLDMQDSNDSLEHASVIIKTTSRECKGRNKFTKEEDVAMITYLIEEHRDHEAGGTRVWKDMEMLEITSHSAQSMSARYRKVIMLNLDNYKYDISKSWMSRLAGYVKMDKEPEFSFEALFPKRRKKSLEMVSTEQKKDRSDKAGKIFNKEKSSSASKSSKNTETPMNENVENADKVVDKEDAGLSKEQKTKETSDRRNTKEAVDRQKTKEAGDRGVVCAAEAVVVLEDCRLCPTGDQDEYNFPSDLDNSPTRNSPRIRKRVSGDITSASPRDSNKRRALLQNSVGSVDNTTPPSNTGNKVVDKDGHRSPHKGDLVGSIGRTTPPSNTGERKNCQRSPRKGDLAGPIGNTTTPSNMGKVVNKNCNISPHEGDFDVNNNNSVEDCLVEDSVSGELSSGDSFDEMLCKYIDGQNKINTDTLSSPRGVNSIVTTCSKNASKATEERQCEKTATRALDSSKPEKNGDSQSKTNSARPMTRSATTTKKDRAVVSVTLSDSEGEEESHSERSDGDISPTRSIVQPQELELSYNSDSDEEPELITTCKAIANNFGLETGYVRELLYSFSGDVDTMLKWIEKGPEYADVRPWTESDDEELAKGQQKAMESKYGQQNVKTRLFFLGGLEIM